MSVLIPVAGEEPGLFREVLARILAQEPDEVLVVINGPEDPDLAAICAATKGVLWTWTPQAGKRNALRMAVEQASGDVAVIVDSDTLWTAGTLRELVKPFRDPKIGGVSTRQRILQPRRSVLTRWADWLEVVRGEYSMPAMSVLGTIGCLPGRTVAIRMGILRAVMPDFLTARFLGIMLEVSDDRTLTNLVLRAGYRTAYQSTALVYTDAPVALGKLIRQQLRWARGSQYNTLRMPALDDPAHAGAGALLPSGHRDPVHADRHPRFLVWVRHQRLAQRVLYAALPLPSGHWQSAVSLIALAIVMTVLSVAVRFGRHFAYAPRDLLYLPMFTAINTLLLMPIRIAGFMRMGHDSGWGTRGRAGYTGTRRLNPLAIIPYVLGVLMLGIAVRIGV